MEAPGEAQDHPGQQDVLEIRRDLGARTQTAVIGIFIHLDNQNPKL